MNAMDEFITSWQRKIIVIANAAFGKSVEDMDASERCALAISAGVPMKNCAFSSVDPTTIQHFMTMEITVVPFTIRNESGGYVIAYKQHSHATLIHLSKKELS